MLLKLEHYSWQSHGKALLLLHGVLKSSRNGLKIQKLATPHYDYHLALGMDVDFIRKAKWSDSDKGAPPLS
ncbi:hypothetical protein Agabi119p4_9104 [Agaricus bisporus var. burnettii]|uniref:Uncharacterized protein n=1 Tax=Agaricus bisporus var. burnettii TaxID=192524 RepID=A0A8H7C4Z6_AGABI|nr:hypothetical protein Agabi119p4_9104 [Agaricus bisporus var. burnettii]